MQCPSCNAPAPDGSRFCPACAAPLQQDPSSTSLPTEAAASYTPSSAPGDPPGRFLPGTMIDARYRIGGMLGRGGMGEVYRADDIKLGQPVALKFLPRHMEQDEQWLERFLNEVRTARQVTHPNVCRVYDVGEVDGQHFLSMEYVDGEDLASLLRRIGRLPEEKATQIGRQLCAGLAASHQEGVLHRDLKPANVMIDGRGRVRITDFGLARWADSVQGGEALAGTPGYMAPEQIAGKEASARSDIYALGLVLYELYTGKQVYQAKNLAELRRLQEESTPTSMGSLVEHLDPSVEEAVGRCLSRDPARRPSSALNVAAALPGGDPLAAALAAGETPSPELVAAAGETGSLSARTGVLLVLAILLLAAAVVGVQGELALHRVMLSELSPPVLENQARELLRELGHPADVGDSAYGLQWNAGYLEQIGSSDKADQLRRAASEIPAALEFWYREDPLDLVPWRTSILGVYGYRVSPEDPPPVEPGCRNISLGPGGHLITLAALGVQRGPAEPPDWGAVFAAAGLDPAAFAEAEPLHLAPVPSDTRQAWTGTYPDEPDWPLRIEAASLSGVPVWFRQFGPWDPADPQEAAEDQRKSLAALRFGSIFFVVIFVGGIGVFLWMARRNLRAGRADRGGTGRLIAFLFAANLLFWLFHASHVGHLGFDGYQLLGALSWALGRAFFAAVIFLALEPYIRRYWPDRMISWTRLLSGRWRDPLVARDLLFGAAAAAGAGLVVTIAFYAVGGPQVNTGPALTDAFLSGRYAVANVLGSFNSAVGNSLMMLAFLVLLRVLLRIPWLATALWVALVTFFQMMQMGGLQLSVVPVALAMALTLAFVIHRFGLLSYVGTSFWFWIIGAIPLTTDFNAWYATSTILTLGAFVAFVIGAFSVATRGQFSETRPG